MALKIFISSLILSFFIIIPLGLKFKIGKKILIPSAFAIGIMTGLIVYVFWSIWGISFYHILIISILLIVVIAVCLIIWRFYRDPERLPPSNENVVLSPADGTIIYVKKIEEGGIPFSEKRGRKFHIGEFIQSNILTERGYLIGISMNYLDVHVNRAPIGGKIVLLKHIKGSFISLRKMEAVVQNERVLTVIDNNYFRVGIIQIASRLVRRIVPYFKEGQIIQAGERIGLIRFGSQVDLILPDLPSIHITVKPEEQVKACESIIASFDKIV